MTILHFGCIHCDSNVILSATPVDYGAKIRLVVNCTSCGYVEELTDKINQVSYQDIEDLLNQG